MKRALFVIFVGVACLCGGLAQAQDLDGLKLHTGQSVRVTDDAGIRTSGPILSITAESLRLGDREFTRAEIARIERKRDRLWNGLAIGAAVGALLPLLPTEACLNQSTGECVAAGIVSGALLGVGIDALHRGYTTVYRGDAAKKSVRVAPQIERHAQGLSLVMTF